MASKVIGTVRADPVKSFFVHMLTRDIQLQDAILDLLDNCIDGVQRSATKAALRKAQPYEGYWARITLNDKEFRIEDNCGGIPWAMKEYAFRLGRLKNDLDQGRMMIGTYGIGMKRAIFKLGNDCRIETHAKDQSYSIVFSPEWMSDESNWDVQATELRPSDRKGTSIVVESLREPVRKQFSSGVFMNDFRETLSTYYAFIMSKGFQVFLNAELIEPKSLRLLYAKGSDKALKTHRIEPFIYQAYHDGVEVFLAVGFTRLIPSSAEADEGKENYKERYSSADAGWTIVCNDRTVLYCDKTHITGWGVSGVPRYHSQFVAISGIAIFTAEDPQLLPTTTTKRGVDSDSELYQLVKDKMMEGMKLFTSYTNKWKSAELVEKSRNQFRKTSSASVKEIRARSSKVKMTRTRGLNEGKQHKPLLPRPRADRREERISFVKPSVEVRRVSKYLFDRADEKPSHVGEKCFDLLHEEAQG